LLPELLQFLLGLHRREQFVDAGLKRRVGELLVHPPHDRNAIGFWGSPYRQDRQPPRNSQAATARRCPGYHGIAGSSIEAPVPVFASIDR
jgi:hypothetical protein